MKLNNKGFSMIEILAVVVILGIVSTVGIVAVTRLVDSSKKHYYENQKKQLVLAGQAYAGDNKNILPRNVGERAKVELDTLYTKNYIKDTIVDKNKENCYEKDKKVNGKDVKGSYVTITKITNKEYAYEGYLFCPSCGVDGNCEEEIDDGEENKHPNVDIKFPANSNNTLFDETTTIDLTYKAIRTNTVISSYSYKIYVDGVLKYNSGIKVNGKRAELEVHEPIYKYLPGNVKVVATITNSKGDTKSYSKTKDYKDAAFPACGMVKYDEPDTMPSHKSQETDTKECGKDGFNWIKIGPNTRHVWVVCDDLKGIGCQQPEFSRLLETDGYKDEIIIKDNNNNKDHGEDHKCLVMKCIDKKSPKITVNIKNGSTIKKTYKVEAQRTTANHTPKDKYDTWLNLENYPNGVTVEVIVNDGEDKKDDSSLINNFKWYQNPKEKKDSEVNHNTEANSKIYDETNKGNRNECKGPTKRVKKECKEYKYSKTITEDGVRREVITVQDYAGNKVTYSLILKIDRTPPTVPTTNLKKWKNNSTRPTSSAGLSNYSNNTWYSGKVFTYPSGSVDKPDVSGFKEYRYKTTGKTTNNTNTVATYRNVEAEGVSYIYWRSCDNANNCSNYNAAKTIKLDRTNPTCSVRNSGGSPGNNGWYKGGTVTATGYCSDQSGLSGCKVSSQFIQSISSNTSGTTKSITLYDNANNSVKCTSTIKYDSSRPACSISKSNLNQPEGVTLSTSCWDNGPSGVGSCTGTRYGIKSSQTHYVTDNAGNGNSCSINVYSKSQRRTCTTCSSCAAAGCALYKRCTNVACGQYYNYHTYCGNCVCDPSGGAAAGSYNAGPCESTSTSGYPYGCCHQYCMCGSGGGGYSQWYDTITKTCRTPGCGCQTYKTSCPSCGCSSWGGWYDSSCSSSSSVQCRTVYY